jgi:hypothetical protein
VRAAATAGTDRGTTRSSVLSAPAIAWAGLTVLGLVLGLYYVLVLGDGGSPVDAHAYFVAPMDDMYRQTLRVDDWPGIDTFVYSPAFAQALSPLVAAGWTPYIVTLRVLDVLILVALTGPLSPLLIFASSVASEINAANIHLYLAFAIVLGFRWPAAWAFVLLSKVTPGIGLLWFAARGEWRSLAIALGVTAAIVLASFAIAPGAWADWIEVLRRNTSAAPGWVPIDAPLWFRLAVSGLIVVWGARTDRPWTVAVAATLSLPAVWWPGLSILVAAIPFLIRTPVSPLLPAAFRPTRGFFDAAPRPSQVGSR